MSNHQAIRDNIVVGDILLSRAVRSPISIVIQGVTRSVWSHSFFYIGDNKIIESDWGGIVIHPLDKYLNKQYQVGLFRASPSLSEEQQTDIVKKARGLLGIKYGYLQLVWGLILRLLGKSEDPDWSLDVDPGMICSEMMGHAFSHVGYEIKKDLEPSQLEPVDFDESPITVRVV